MVPCLFATEKAQLGGFDHTSHQVKSQIVKGSMDRKVRLAGLDPAETTFTKLLEKARNPGLPSVQAELMDKHQNKSQTSTPGTVNYMGKETIAPRRNTKNPKTKNRTCWFCGGSFPHSEGKCPADGKICQTCGKSGHFKSVWHPASRQPKQKSTNKANKHMKQVKHIMGGDSSSDGEVYSIRQTTTPSHKCF